MLRMTFQGQCLFLGKKRKHGETICEELNEALASGKTTMVAVTAMKNRGLAMLQDSDEIAKSSPDVAQLAADVAGLKEQMNRIEELLTSPSNRKRAGA